jgi:hypothetical protein
MAFDCTDHASVRLALDLEEEFTSSGEYYLSFRPDSNLTPLEVVKLCDLKNVSSEIRDSKKQYFSNNCKISELSNVSDLLKRSLKNKKTTCSKKTMSELEGHLAKLSLSLKKSMMSDSFSIKSICNDTRKSLIDFQSIKKSCSKE